MPKTVSRKQLTYPTELIWLGSMEQVVFLAELPELSSCINSAVSMKVVVDGSYVVGIVVVGVSVVVCLNPGLPIRVEVLCSPPHILTAPLDTSV